jgi:hypothetical protein
MRLFALCLLIALLPNHVVGQNSKPQPSSRTTHSQNATTPQNPTSQVVIESQSNQQPADQQDSARKRVEHRFLPNPEWVTAISTFLILVATSAYALVSYFTLRKIRESARIAERQAREVRRQRFYMGLQWKAMKEQTKKMEGQLAEMERQTAATKDAARAAQTSANALIVGERAWLLVEDITAGAINFIRAPQFSFRVVNYGRTPAQVHGYRAYCQISASDEIPDDRSFMEGSGGRGDDPIVPPNGEPLKISSTDMRPPFAIYPTQEEVEKIAANPPELYLWACGYVSYWDVFGKDAQEVKDLKITPFAMVYRASQAKLMRPTFPFLNRPT